MYPCGSKKIKGKGKETEQWGAFAFLTFVTAYVNNHFCQNKLTLLNVKLH